MSYSPFEDFQEYHDSIAGNNRVDSGKADMAYSGAVVSSTLNNTHAMSRLFCPISGIPCDEKKNTCEPDWNGNGEPAYCHLK